MELCKTPRTLLVVQSTWLPAIILGITLSGFMLAAVNFKPAMVGFPTDPSLSLAAKSTAPASEISNSEWVKATSMLSTQQPFGCKRKCSSPTPYNGKFSIAKLNAMHCDIYTGKWVQDDTYPLYKPDSCPFVDKKFNCQQNGRPDSNYTRWRWAPTDCEIPRFNGTYLLEILRGKRLVFVGDSVNRNQWESLLCMLRESLVDKTRISRVHGSGRNLLFMDYNCTVEFYKSRYLVNMVDGTNETDYIIQLDKMDKIEKKWRNADVLVFNTGHWWGPGKVGNGENRFQERNTIHSKLDAMTAYKKALTTWAKWVDEHVDPKITRVFFRSYAPGHFRGGAWNAGGRCDKEKMPVLEQSELISYPEKLQALESVLENMRVPVHVLNITDLTEYRKDAHPSQYWHPQHLVVQYQDCSHWCLPGVPDIWNELLYYTYTMQMMS